MDGGQTAGRVKATHMPPGRLKARIVSAVGGHDGLADRQPDAHAGHRGLRPPRSNRSNTLSSFVGRKTAAAAHPQLHRFRPGVGLKRDGRTRRRILGGVFEKIAQHPLDQHRIELEQRQRIEPGDDPHRMIPLRVGPSSLRLAPTTFLDRLPLGRRLTARFAGAPCREDCRPCRQAQGLIADRGRFPASAGKGG